MRYIKTGIAIAAASVSHAAIAQVDNSTVGTNDTETAASSTAETNAGITQILVTAQRREETVQNSSLSIDVVSSEELVSSNLADAEGLSRLVPNLQIGTFAYSRIYLRGVGDNTVNGIAQSAVAFNVDSVHIARSTQFSGGFYDVNRVEVLKGPQGTLYGRNASAGVINVITNEPNFDTEGSVMLNLGNYDLIHVQGMANTPLSSTLAARVAFNVIDRDGYLDDGYNDASQQSGRLRLLWEPNNSISLGLRGEYTHTGGMGQGPVLFPVPPGADPWMASSGDLFRQYQIVTNAPRVPDDGFVDNSYAGISAELNADLGFAELTIIPAYRWQDFEFFASPAGTLNFYEQDDVEQKTLEVRLARNTERLNLVVGGYYFDEETDFDAQIDAPATAGGMVGPSTLITSYIGTTEAIAFFADGRISLTDNLRVLAGVRYTDEERGLFGVRTTYSSVPNAPPCPPSIGTIDPSLPFCVRGSPDNSVQNDAWTWRAGVEFDLSPDSMFYFTVDRGFKSGGIFSGGAPGNDYDPEFLTSYNGGIRNQFFNHTLQLNIEAFYWDYTDYQFSFVNVDTRGIPAFVTRNAGSARLYGASADIVWQPAQSDTFRANIEYLNTKFTDFTYSTPFPVDANRECASLGIVDFVTNPTGATSPLFGHDCSGLPLPRAPHWTISAGWTHEFELANGGMIVADIDGQFSSSYMLDFTTVDFMEQGSYALLNAQVAYHSPDDNYEIALWMRNMTNEAVYNDARRFGSTNFSGADIRPPRTFGIRGQFRF
ncbi:TonB-dependent receptor [Parasphingopyxis marina]|uniref:TonB-dependent receptor n=1 Tax=Parasphingopyxis marina TaxID=2761622 RepID=UPI001C8DD381|nr:TonB-dependent receptor [Parasphingopyxis marina]